MAGWNLKKFRDVIRTVARPQYYMVRLPMIGNDDVVTALSRECSIPAYELGTVGVPFKGMNMNIVDKPSIGTWSCTFLLDESHCARNLLLKWASQAYNAQILENDRHGLYKQDTVSVTQLTSHGEPVSTCTFVGIFPSSIGEVSVTQDGSGFEVVPVTFTYDYFNMNSITGDFLNSDVDIDLGNTGVMVGATPKPVDGMNLNLKTD
jgi:hypothetical protein